MEKNQILQPDPNQDQRPEATDLNNRQDPSDQRQEVSRGERLQTQDSLNNISHKKDMAEKWGPSLLSIAQIIATAIATIHLTVRMGEIQNDGLKKQLELGEKTLEKTTDISRKQIEEMKEQNRIAESNNRQTKESNIKIFELTSRQIDTASSQARAQLKIALDNFLHTKQQNDSTLSFQKKEFSHKYFMDRRSQIIDRYFRASSLLSDSSLTGRILSLYALEQIANESTVPADRYAILEIICAYIRINLSPPSSLAKIGDDIQLALDIVLNIARLERISSKKLNLTNLIVVGASFRRLKQYDTYVKNIDFSGSYFVDCEFTHNFEQCDFNNVHFCESRVLNCYFRQCSFNSEDFVEIENDMTGREKQAQEPRTIVAEKVPAKVYGVRKKFEELKEKRARNYELCDYSAYSIFLNVGFTQTPIKGYVFERCEFENCAFDVIQNTQLISCEYKRRLTFREQVEKVVFRFPKDATTLESVMHFITSNPHYLIDTTFRPMNVLFPEKRP